MIDLNIKTYHILMKLFLQDFIKKDHGRILNVASAAGFLTGPNLSTYYATKNYIAKLKEMKSHVSISVLCPGPVATEFERVAEGKFLIQEFSAKNIAIYSINQALKNKKIIIPGFFSKLGLFSSRFLPWSFIAKIMSKIQKKV